ncbi:Lrp/AsnC family transcriptional regulator [Nigerium massiliense]|uniref:Lrp/AsnC family transcriptional regulator n=1 Tax=Nigerium massiliense TaxID=1522317 RepID=UPI00058E3777|nr:Lrp/AsnC family transcriptional regulator [Nigerium massiliense]
MESTDQQILALLARDGRMSYTDIGRETGLSTSAAQQRVRRLEQRGVITGYRALVDPGSLGKVLTAMIELRATDPDAEELVPERIAELPEVVTCYSVAGDASHMLIAQVGTPLELESLLTKIRTSARVSTRTTLVLSVPFEHRPLV